MNANNVIIISLAQNVKMISKFLILMDIVKTNVKLKTQQIVNSNSIGILFNNNVLVSFILIKF